MICDRCQTPQHADCFAYAGGCAIYGCKPSVARRPVAAGAPAIRRAPAPERDEEPTHPVLDFVDEWLGGILLIAIALGLYGAECLHFVAAWHLAGRSLLVPVIIRIAHDPGCLIRADDSILQACLYFKPPLNDYYIPLPLFVLVAALGMAFGLN